MEIDRVHQGIRARFCRCFVERFVSFHFTHEEWERSEKDNCCDSQHLAPLWARNGSLYRKLNTAWRLRSYSVIDSIAKGVSKRGKHVAEAVQLRTAARAFPDVLQLGARVLSSETLCELF